MMVKTWAKKGQFLLSLMGGILKLSNIGSLVGDPLCLFLSSRLSGHGSLPDTDWLAIIIPFLLMDKQVSLSSSFSLSEFPSGSTPLLWT